MALRPARIAAVNALAVVLGRPVTTGLIVSAVSAWMGAAQVQHAMTTLLTKGSQMSIVQGHVPFAISAKSAE